MKGRIKKVWPVMVSLGSASLMLLAFFIPSLQDQWDRYQARRIIQQYEQLGDDLYTDELYEMAEKAYEKAFELSEQKRLDIEVKRLEARVNRISSTEEWGSAPPEDLEDIDFQFLLYLLRKDDNKLKRVPILNGYSVYLSGMNRLEDARKALAEAISIDPNDALVHINMGNLLDQLGEKKEAADEYLKALSLDSLNVQGHYNLGLLYSEQNRFKEATKELEKALRLEPNDSTLRSEYELVKSKIR